MTGGWHLSEKTKAKIRLSKLGVKNPMYGIRLTGERNGMYGKHHSEETKDVIRAKITGKKRLAETKAKLRATKLGKLNPNWKGDKATPKAGRTRARRLFKCPKGRERHHIDGNPLNNSPENINFVTRRQHQILDGRLEKIRNLNKKEGAKNGE